MMHKLYPVIFILFMLSGVWAQSDDWKADKAHSNIAFSVAHLVISDVQGKFTDYDVTMTTSKHDLSDASVEVVIRTASISTENEKRDKHLRSGDFFNVEKYPTITFESKSFEKTGDNKYKVTGDLTMNGVTKEVVLDMIYRGQAKDPWGNVKAGFKATTVLDRYDFGLKYNSALETGALLIGEDVQINIDLEMEM